MKTKVAQQTKKKSERAKLFGFKTKSKKAVNIRLLTDSNNNVTAVHFAVDGKGDMIKVENGNINLAWDALERKLKGLR